MSDRIDSTNVFAATAARRTTLVVIRGATPIAIALAGTVVVGGMFVLAYRALGYTAV